MGAWLTAPRACDGRYMELCVVVRRRLPRPVFLACDWCSFCASLMDRCGHLALTCPWKGDRTPREAQQKVADDVVRKKRGAQRAWIVGWTQRKAGLLGHPGNLDPGGGLRLSANASPQCTGTQGDGARPDVALHVVLFHSGMQQRWLPAASPSIAAITEKHA